MRERDGSFAAQLRRNKGDFDALRAFAGTKMKKYLDTPTADQLHLEAFVAKTISWLYPQVAAIAESLAASVVAKAYPEGVSVQDKFRPEGNLMNAFMNGEAWAQEMVATAYGIAAAAIPGSKCSKAVYRLNLHMEVPAETYAYIQRIAGTKKCKIVTFLNRYAHLLETGGNLRTIPAGDEGGASAKEWVKSLGAFLTVYA